MLRASSILLSPGPDCSRTYSGVPFIIIESASRSPPGLVELVALLESFIRMEHLFELMFMALGYLLGSHLATWGVLGTLFGVIFAPSGHFWEHFGDIFCVQKWDGAPQVPQEAPPPKKTHPFGPFWVPKSSKVVSRGTPKRVLKFVLKKCS